MLNGTIHFEQSDATLVICTIVANAFIIAEKVYFFIICRCSARHIGGLSEISSFCSKTTVRILHSAGPYLLRRLFCVKTLKKTIAGPALNIIEFTCSNLLAK